MNPGKLFVVATPIGNLSDITYRAVEVLTSVHFIVCEDTRETLKLLRAISLSKELVSFNARTEEMKIPFIINRMLNGSDCALVTDAGTPCISDPGIRLVHQAHKNNVEVIGIPGPNAAILALSIAGLPTDSFVFEGFIPQKKGRQKKLKELSLEPRTIVLYESTYRLIKLLQEINDYMPNRIVAVCKEMTKMHEEIFKGTPSVLIENLKNKIVRGEFVVIISPLKWKE